MEEIGTFGGYSMAPAINDSGQIVGQSANSTGIVTALLFSNGIMQDIDKSKWSSAAFDINDAGQIVGNIGNNLALLYQNDKMIDLNTLIDSSSGINLIAGIGINNNGQIIADGSFGSYSGGHAFLLMPVPEPSSIVLSIIGLSSYITIILKRRRMFLFVKEKHYE